MPATDDTLRQVAADLGYDYDTGQKTTAPMPEPSTADKLTQGLQVAARDPRYLKGVAADSPQLRRAVRTGFEGLARMQGAESDPLDALTSEQAVQVWRQRDGVQPSPQWMRPELEEQWSAELESEYHELIDRGGMRGDVAQGILDRYVELRGRLGANHDDTIAAIKDEWGRMLEPSVMRALEAWARDAAL